MDAQGSCSQEPVTGRVGTERWRNYLRYFRDERRSEIDPHLAAAFAGEVERDGSLRARYSELVGILSTRANQDSQRTPSPSKSPNWRSQTPSGEVLRS